MSSNVTIKDVAKEASVSIATVSRVLNNKGFVNSETKNLVQNAIKKLNYQPNEIARSLINAQTKTIGILIPDLQNEFFNELITGLNEVILSKGHKIMLCMTKEAENIEKMYLNELAHNKVSGVIICSHLKNIDYFKSLHLPCVFIERPLDDDTPSVSSNNYRGGTLAAKELIARHVTEIAYLHGGLQFSAFQDRSKGFFHITRKHPQLKVHMLGIDFATDYTDKLSRFFVSHPHIDGIFAISDHIAAKSIQVLHTLGKRIPEDIQIIGYDNTRIAQFLTPPLSTISQPIYEMGQTAARLLFDVLNGRSVTTPHVVLPVRYIERGTTRG